MYSHLREDESALIDTFRVCWGENEKFWLEEGRKKGRFVNLGN